ncbi:hypothetical protein L195_g046800 [Trifolium pratense]|uniref:RNase H type-1 domain-containing protein n=1 Tax=Trifolium pratense TaxID=57577 RepID=A0A2K3MIQ1_TRIPR|nr:hypothetical protein L195_g046800 [Trifolium pratense]
MGGLAAVVRDSNGVVMAAGCWCQPIVPDPDVPEGMTLLLGMEFAKDMLFKDVEINSDSACNFQR